MPTLVSTGQFTIVDNNDAKPITAFIAANGSTQQIYTLDDAAVTYLPDYTTSNLTLTPKVYAGTTTDIAATLTNKSWKTALGGATLPNGASTTYVVNTNTLTPAAPSITYYFEGDYTDTVTGLMTHIIAQISLNQVKTGSNAVYIRIDGQTVIEDSNNSTKNTITITAQLMRAAGVDNLNTTYKWFKAPFAVTDQIDGNPLLNTQFGFIDTAAVGASKAGAVGTYVTTAAGTSTPISSTNVPDGAFGDYKALVIGEAGITNIGYFMVQAKDANADTYQQYFTCYDVSDAIRTNIISSAGDKLQNGIGSTVLTPELWYGTSKISPADIASAWTFVWEFYDRNSNRGGFINNAKSPAGGVRISGNTAGTGGVITFEGAPVVFTADDIIKCVKATGEAFFYEATANATAANTVTIKANPINNTFLTFANFAAPGLDTFKEGRFYVCVATRTTATVTLTGDEVDAKARIAISSYRT